MTQLVGDLSADSNDVAKVISDFTADEDAVLWFRDGHHARVVYKLLGNGKTDEVNQLLEATNFTLDSNTCHIQSPFDPKNIQEDLFKMSRHWPT